MNRSLLVVGALVAVIIAIGAWLWLRTPEAAGARSTATTSETPTGTSAVETPSVRAADGTTTTVAPSLPADPSTVTAAADGTREYTVNGVLVRDHRSGDHPKMDVPANIAPPDGRKISPLLTNAVSEQLQRVMSECTASQIPKTARGEKPRLEGQVLIAIKDHQASVTKSTLLLRDITADVAPAAVHCMEQSAASITTPAADEPDLESYAINISFAVR